MKLMPIAVLVIAMGTVPDIAGAQGDPVKGEAIYARCGACHSLEVDRTGPRHCGLFGRRAGSLPGFPYSEAMKGSGIVWSESSLSDFLASPLERVPGTSMGYAGIQDSQERADLIAYLRRASDSMKCARSGRRCTSASRQSADPSQSPEGHPEAVTSESLPCPACDESPTARRCCRD